MNRNIISILFHFLLFFVIFICVIELFFYYILKGKKSIKGKKMQIFGLLMGLNNLTVFSLAALILKYLFIIFSLFDNSSLFSLHLIVLLLLSILFGITSLSVKNTIVEVASSFAVYISIFCFKLLCSYLTDVRVEWYVVLGAIMLLIFIFIYATYFLLRNINYLVSKTRYVRSFRYED